MYSDDEEEDFFDNFEEDYEDPNEIGQEFKAFERTGFMHPLLSGDFKSGMTDSERFARRLNVYLQQYREDYFNDSQINFLLDKIDSIKDIRFKNPLAYALGYFIVDINRSGIKYINKEKFQKIKKIVKEQSEIVSLPDVIRYARLWETI